MDKSFSEILEDELYDTKFTFKTLSSISTELNALLRENSYLRAENKSLNERIKMYQDSINEGIKESRSFICAALKGCLNKDE